MSGFWEKSVVDVLICTAITGSELVFFEVSEARSNMTLNFPKDLKIVQMKFPEPCIDITRDSQFHEGMYVGRLGGFTLWRNMYFASAADIPRAIRESDIELVAAVCPDSIEITERDYHNALLKLLSL